MKMKLLSTAVAAGLGLGLMSNAAQAVYVNHDGLGQVLIYPYYTTEGGNNTNFQVVNTSNNAKVVKVRFLEAENSQEVLDFNLYLSAHDEWAGAVVNTANGAKLVTNDNSCTAPGNAAIKAGVDFRNVQYQGDMKSNGTVANDGLDRTREGYIEIIGMGDISPSSNLGAAITHGSNGVPANCSYVTSNSDATISADVSAPTGGLYGYGTLVNVANGTAATYDATALQAFTGGATYTAPGSIYPSLSNVNPAIATIFNGTTATDVGNFTNPIDAVSATMMASHIMNDYVVDPALNAGTDWVVTFPTKRFYVNQSPVPAPFTTAWSTANSQACEPIGLTYYDREEQTTSSPLDFSPQPTTQGASLCYEANVVSFNDSNVLAAQNAVYNLNLASGFTAGWMDMDLTGTGHTLTGDNLTAGSGTVTLTGLPAIGFADIQFQNGMMKGVQSNYAGITNHKVSQTPAN